MASALQSQSNPIAELELDPPPALSGQINGFISLLSTATASSKSGPNGSNCPEIEIEIGQVAKDVADQLRDLRYRASIGANTDLIVACFRFLNSLIDGTTPPPSPTPTTAVAPRAGLISQLLRVIGNLVHTHDRNRQKCLDAGAASVLSILVRDMVGCGVKRGVFEGACAQGHQTALVVIHNLCLGYLPAQTSLAEAGLLSTLVEVLDLAYEYHPAFCLLPLRISDELCSTDAGLSNLPPDLVLTVCRALVSHAASLGEGPAAENYFSSVVACANLLDTVTEHADLSKCTSWLFLPASARSVDSANPPGLLCERLLCFIRYAPVPAGLEDDDGESAETTWGQVKASVGRAVVVGLAYGSAEPEAKTALFALLVGWAREQDVRERRPDLVALIGLGLGNLCSDERSCQMLVDDHRLLEPLSDVIKTWSPVHPREPDSAASRARPGEQVQVLHAWCGVARNLAIADTYKTRLGCLGLLECASECLASEFDTVEPLKAAAVGLLRHLCRNNPENVARLLALHEARPVLELIERVDQPVILLEACRLLATIVGGAAQLGGGAGLAAERAAEALVRFLLLAANARRGVLVNEALVGLALVAHRPGVGLSMCTSLTKVREAGGASGSEETGARYASGLDALLGYWIPSREEGEVPEPMRQNAAVVLKGLGAGVGEAAGGVAQEVGRRVLGRVESRWRGCGVEEALQEEKQEGLPLQQREEESVRGQKERCPIEKSQRKGDGGDGQSSNGSRNETAVGGEVVEVWKRVLGV